MSVKFGESGKVLIPQSPVEISIAVDDKATLTIFDRDGNEILTLSAEARQGPFVAGTATVEYSGEPGFFSYTLECEDVGNKWECTISSSDNSVAFFPTAVYDEHDNPPETETYLYDKRDFRAKGGSWTFTAPAGGTDLTFTRIYGDASGFAFSSVSNGGKLLTAAANTTGACREAVFAASWQNAAGETESGILEVYQHSLDCPGTNAVIMLQANAGTYLTGCFPPVNGIVHANASPGFIIGANRGIVAYSANADTLNHRQASVTFSTSDESATLFFDQENKFPGLSPVPTTPIGTPTPPNDSDDPPITPSLPPGTGGGDSDNDTGGDSNTPPVINVEKFCCDPAQIFVAFNETAAKTEIIGGPADSALADGDVQAALDGALAFPVNTSYYPKRFYGYWLKGDQLATCCVEQAGDPDADPVVDPPETPIVTDPPEPHVALYPGNVSVDALGNTVYLSLFANQPWTLAADSSLVSLSAESGNGDTTIIVKIPANNSETPRLFTLTLSGNNGAGALAYVDQAGTTGEIIEPPPYLAFSPGRLDDFAGAGGTWTLRASANVEFLLASHPEWLTVSPDAGTFAGGQAFTVTAEANTSGIDRCDELVFSYDGGDVRVPVYQIAQTLVDPENKILTPKISVAPTGATVGIYGVAKKAFAWTFEMADGSAFPEWLVPVETSGIGDDEQFVAWFTVADFSEDESEATSRTADLLVTFSDGETLETASASITQSRQINTFPGTPQIEITDAFPETLVPQAGGTITCCVLVENSSVEPVCSYSAAGIISGVECEAYSDESEVAYVYTFTVAENPSTNRRACTVTFSLLEHGLSVSDSFRQERTPPKALRVIKNIFFTANRKRIKFY